MSESVVLRDANGDGFRLALKDGSYRDFNMGVHVIADDDPAKEELLVWAKKQPNISIIMEGKASKVGIEVCPVCGKDVPGDALPDHMEEVHVDREGIRQSVGLAPSEEPKPRRSRR